VARKIDSILSDNRARTPTFGAKSSLAFPENMQVAAKTGTSQDFRDAWTIGFTPSLAVAVWCGNNDGHPMFAGSDGVFVAAPIWRNFMDRNLWRYPAESFVNYDSWSSLKTINFTKFNGREKKNSMDNKKMKQ
jgi:membrane carboxypeptidase/penicillin-binding protein PbpC